MKQFKIALLASLFVWGGLLAEAQDLYVAQNASGAGDGSSAGNAEAVSSINYGSLVPGETVHLCGVISSLIYGNNGITYYFESNAMCSQAAGPAFYLEGRQNIVVDGGVNGVINNTNCGTLLGVQGTYTGIDLSGCSNVIVRNLQINNLYIHTSPADISANISGCGGIYANGLSGSNYFYNNSFSNVGWCINVLASPSYMMVSNCTFVNYDHGVVPGGTNMLVVGCDFGSTSNWDSTANAYHHDGIHYFGNTNVNSLEVTRCYFHGNFGNNNTAFIYMEGDGVHGNPPNCKIYDNLFVEAAGNYLNDGMLTCAGNYSQIFNNSFIGCGVTMAGGLSTGGINTVVANNVLVGFNNFVYVAGLAPITLSNNVYAAYGPGGNSPWNQAGTSYSSLQQWQAAIGDTGSLYIPTAATVVNPDGSIPPGSPVKNAGVNMASFISNYSYNGAPTNDYYNAPRATNGPWDVGAIIANYVIFLTPPANLRIVPYQAPSSPTNVSIGLVGQWKFAEGSGATSADASGNGDVGNLTGSPAPTWVQGKVGPNALAFNGSSSYVAMTNSLSLNPTLISISAWVKTTYSAGAEQIFAKDHYSNANNGRVWQFRLVNGVVQFIPFTASSLSYGNGTINVADGNWHQVAATWDGSTILIYVDGNQDGSGTSFSGTLNPGQSNNAVIGSDENNGNTGAPDLVFNGAIEDVRLYNRALTATEVGYIFNGAGP